MSQFALVEAESIGRADGNADAIRAIRAEIADWRAQLAALEADLARRLAEAGRRPGDGSDQPALFEPEAQCRLF